MPMSEVPLFRIPWDEHDVSNVVESLSRGGYWTKGPFVDEFEAGLAAYFDVDHALVTNSGTTALVSALHAHGVGPGDEVLVPSFTFVATVNAVELLGATPVFVDIERDTLGMDPAAARDCVTDDTALVLPIHCYGSACRIEDLADVATDHDVPLLEDAAEAFGTVADGRKVGTFGDTAALSFCQNKVLPTGEGGAVLTDDDDLAAAVRQIRSHGRSSDDYFDSADSGTYPAIGSNYRMPDMVAALGCSQLAKVEDLIQGRRRVARQYHDELADVDGVSSVSGRDGEDDRHVYQLYSVVFDDSGDRSAVVDELSARDIACKVYWDPPVHRTEYYRDRTDAVLPVTDDVASRVLSLPMHPELSESDIERVVDGVRCGLR
jgi:perosamine synthetase